jgi:hypothetical protein
MSIVLISTTDVDSGRSQVLDRMLMSVAQAASKRPGLSIVSLLLLQRCQADRVPALGLPSFVHALSMPDRTSLSAARNILLLQAVSRGLIRPMSVVGFPDDDCWYPSGTLECIADLFVQEPELDLWFTRYSSAPRSMIETHIGSRPASVRDLIRNASSNTLFVRGKVILSGVLFDEGLGVGTPIGGAEDMEFALRARGLCDRAMYLDASVVGHRDKNAELRAKYYAGGLIAIARHARRQGSILVELMRKIAVGGWLALTGELSFTAFFRALSAAFHAWRMADANPIASSKQSAL